MKPKPDRPPQLKPLPKFKPGEAVTFPITFMARTTGAPQWIDELGTYAYWLQDIKPLDGDRFPVSVSADPYLCHQYELT